ncbi:MAG: dihydrodipicolinate reductase [Thermoproteota archaeon]
MPIRVAVYGLGPIGMLIAKNIIEREELQLVAAFEIDPSKVGRDLGEFLGLGKNLNLTISNEANATEILKENDVDIVLHSTSSYLDKIYPQVVKCVEAGTDLISTSETLVNPWYRYPQLASKIDRIAKERNVSVLGAGINPGFIFDTLPILMTLVCAKVNSLKIVRSLDAAKRRFSFQKKYGLALSVEEFKQKMRDGEITAHVGYAESIDLIASALGIKLTKIVENQEPIVAKEHVRTQYFDIAPGRVSGIHGYGIGYEGEKEFVRVELFAEVGREEFEEITIEGIPSVRWRSSGTAGDIATAAIVVNLIPRVLKAQAGLLRITDLPLPSAFLSLKRDKVQ